MKKILYAMLFSTMFIGVSHAAVTYDNGQYNMIDSFVNDDVWVLDSATLQPTSVDIQPSGNIIHSVWVYSSSNLYLNGGSIGDFGRDVHAYGDSYIEINSGNIGRYLNLYANSKTVISGGAVQNTVSLYDNSTLTMYDGNIGGGSRELMLYNSSKAYVYGGTIGRNVYVSNSGLLMMGGGKIGSNIFLNNNAEFKMSGGSIAQYLFAEDTSVVELSGGWVNWAIHARHDAEITIVGTGFNYPLGYITDASGTLTGTLANGDPISTDFIREGNGVILLRDPDISLTVVSPNGGERFLTDKPINIEYTTEGDSAIENVDIEYSSDNGSSWILIASGIQNTGVYQWTTPTIDSEDYLIRVSSSDNSTIADTSDNSFIIFNCGEINPADINSDCYVNLYDLAILAEEWLWCGDRYNPDCENY